MKARMLSAFVALVCTAPMALFVACASDETGSGIEPDAGGALPTVDGGLDGPTTDADANVESVPCTEDALCPFGPFDPSTAGGALDVRTRVKAIRARSATDVWLAGVSGMIAHYDGTSWKRSDTGSIETMSGLWLRDGDEIAIAKLSSLYRRNLDADAGVPSADGWTAVGKPAGPSQLTWSSELVASAWTAPGAEWLWVTTIEDRALTSLQTAVNGLWRLRVVSATNQLELGNAVPPGTCATIGCRQMTSVHGSSADDLWAVGYTGATFHITEAQSAAPKIKPFDSQTWAELDGVWAASATEAWAVGGLGVIRHYTGHEFAWDIVSDVPATETLRAVWGSSPSDVWAVGDGAAVLHYDGKSWARVKIAGLGSRRPNLFTVWTPAPGHVWIGGDGVFLSLGGKP